MAKRALSALSDADLQRELRRRQRGTDRAVTRLTKKRDRLLLRVAAIDAELAKFGKSAGRVGGRRRPKNKMNLSEALLKVLSNATMSVTDVAEAVQKAGYVTTSPSFRTIVNQTLIKDKRFKRVGRGQYTAKA